MMDPIELEINRENTLAFIAQKSIVIALKPFSEPTRVPGGGVKSLPLAARDPQTFRIIETSGRYRDPRVKVQDGLERDVVYWLLGAHDAVVAINDEFEDDDREWKVVDVIRDNNYEVRAILQERGRGR